MDQIWLASPSPALRLWAGPGGATWRLNPAAHAWGRSRQFNEASWRSIAAALSEAHAGSQREGVLAGPHVRWRSLPMSTGWLVWLTPEAAPAAGSVPLASTGGDDPADETERIPRQETVGQQRTERDRAERLARRIDMVADAAEAGIWLQDLDTGEVEWNRQMFLVHGLPEDAEPLDLDAYAERIVHPEDREAFLAARREALEADVARFDTEMRVVRPDGSVRWIEYRSRRDRREGHGLCVGVAIDATARIAQRAAAERALREKSLLERANIARSEFLARMSHELRTPLNAVLGFAQLIEHEGVSAPMAVQLERVVRIREAGEQMLRLVGDVLEHLKRDTSTDTVATVPGSLADDRGADDASERALSVLYIEDNPVNVLLVEELVGMRPNTRLRCAVTGLAGVALASALAPDVVLVDMQLPDIDGFEVLRRLRANRALDQSAIIALSANGMGEDIASALAAGFDDYWTKPIDFRHFLTGLDTLAQSR